MMTMRAGLRNGSCQWLTVPRRTQTTLSLILGRDELRYTRSIPNEPVEMSLTQKPKTEVLSPRNKMALDTLAGVRGEMARLYRLALEWQDPRPTK